MPPVKLKPTNFAHALATTQHYLWGCGWSHSLPCPYGAGHYSGYALFLYHDHRPLYFVGHFFNNFAPWQPPPYSNSPSLLGEGPVKYQLCHEFFHIAKSCPHKHAINSVGDLSNFFISLHIQYATPDFWHPDIGASHHMTNKLGILDSIKSYHNLDFIQIGNDTKLTITHIGHKTIPTFKSEFSLSNALVFLDLTKHWLSYS